MDWAIQLMEQLGYVGIFVIVLLENLIPPIPSEVVLPFAGFMTQQGVVSVAGVVVAATLGSVAGARCFYWSALVGAGVYASSHATSAGLPSGRNILRKRPGSTRAAP